MIDLPETLKVYAFHGIDSNYREGAREATATCPWCGREKKFSVNVETGKWRCLVCNEGSEKGKSIRGGNSLTFLQKVWDESRFPSVKAKELAKSRGLTSEKTLKKWGFKWSSVNNEWIVPGIGHKGNVAQLYRWVKVEGKYKLYASPGLEHQIVGRQNYDPNKPKVMLFESLWDAMVVDELIQLCKGDLDSLKPTSNPKLSLGAKTNVIALPGCQSFSHFWVELFDGKEVWLLGQNDHQKMQCIKCKKSRSVTITKCSCGEKKVRNNKIEPASMAAMRRIAKVLSESDRPPESIRMLQWGDDDWWSNELPTGFDMRDILQGNTG